MWGKCECCNEHDFQAYRPDKKTPFDEKDVKERAKQLRMCSNPGHLNRIVLLLVKLAARQGKRLNAKDDVEKSLWVAAVRQRQTELALAQQPQDRLQKELELAKQHRESLDKLRLEAADAKDDRHVKWLQVRTHARRHCAM